VRAAFAGAIALDAKVVVFRVVEWIREVNIVVLALQFPTSKSQFTIDAKCCSHQALLATRVRTENIENRGGRLCDDHLSKV